MARRDKTQQHFSLRKRRDNVLVAITEPKSLFCEMCCCVFTFRATVVLQRRYFMFADSIRNITSAAVALSHITAHIWPIKK